MGNTKQHIHIVVDEDVWREFKIESVRRGVSMTKLLDELLRERLGISEEKGGKGGLIKSIPESEKPDVVKRDTIPYGEIKEMYNRVARESSEDGLPGFKTCRRLDDTRKRRLKKLWLSRDGWDKDLERVGEYFRKCCMERHWRGDNTRGWRADIEFLTRESTVSRAVELEAVSYVERMDPTVAVEKAKHIIRKHVEAEEKQVSDETFQQMLVAFIKQQRLDEQRDDLLQYLSSYESYFTTKGGVS